MGADDANMNGASYAVGYRRPPLHTRFKPGVSGNPSGRAKGSQNLKTLFDRILREEISLREGDVTKKITKAEAILRGLVVGAMKGGFEKPDDAVQAGGGDRTVRGEARASPDDRAGHCELEGRRPSVETFPNE